MYTMSCGVSHYTEMYTMSCGVSHYTEMYAVRSDRSCRFKRGKKGRLLYFPPLQAYTKQNQIINKKITSPIIGYITMN